MIKNNKKSDGLSEYHHKIIANIFSHFPEITTKMIFGSRAKGNYKKFSDIDFAIDGKDVSFRTVSDLKNILDEKPNYSSLKKIYFIGILELNLFNNPEDTSFISQHLIYNKKTGNNDLKDFEFCFIELPKFNKKIDELKDILDKWIFFLKEAQNLNIVPKEFEKIEVLNEAFFTANQVSWNSEELDIYQKITLDENQRINSENVKIEKEKTISRKAGKEEGREEGLESALQKIISSGINENKALNILGL